MCMSYQLYDRDVRDTWNMPLSTKVQRYNNYWQKLTELY